MSDTPFKDIRLFVNEIDNFLNNYSTKINKYASKVSDFFEIACYNYVVKFYEKDGFEVKVKGLQKGKFRYKISPIGYPENFSYVEIKKSTKSTPTIFEVRHNIPIASYENSSDIYIAADIAVIKPGGILWDSTHKYKGKGKYYCYITNKDLLTFFEVKNYKPSPELLVNFTGMANEIMPQSIKGENPYKNPKHLAPSLLVSGSHTIHTESIADIYSKRYNLNIVVDLFNIPAKAYLFTSNLNRIGTK
ncbi:hypothetical protein [Neobacillus niacini]|uniref:hypothetical protein n=1 Tax=Neobacillus niacini TaxID=86668 RepID=UPI001C8ECBB7|nr:hypothetical protein [Neobacillus niacini]MBY0145100.1 hypothetical protein [Neobacillus niacini]